MQLKIIQIQIQLQLQQKQPQMPKPEAPPVIHIGLKQTPLLPNTYSTQILSFTASHHLIINHGEDLAIYDSSRRAIVSRVHHLHSVGYSNAAYSDKWKCLFLVDARKLVTVYLYTADQGMHHIVELAEGINIKSLRHCLHFVYFDQLGYFIVLDSDCIKQVYVDINSNHLRSLFSSAYRFKMQETKIKVLPNCYHLQFSNKIQKCGEYLVFNNSQDVKIIWWTVDRRIMEKMSDQQYDKKMLLQGMMGLAFDRPQVQSNYLKRTILHIKKICESPQQITEILFNPQISTLICGTNQGDLKVYKLNITNLIATSSSSSPLQSPVISLQAKSHLSFKLTLHNSKPITALSLYSSKIILTIGMDQYLQVVSFEQMASIQKFKCDPQLADLCFVSSDTLLAVKTIEFDQFLYAYQVALDCQLLLQHNSYIMQKVFVGKDSMEAICLIVLSDNSINAIHLGKKKKPKRKLTRSLSINIAPKNSLLQKLQSQQNQPQKPPELPKQSFIPPDCNSILQIQACPYPCQTPNSLQFWILTDQSQIYRYRYWSGMPPSPQQQSPSQNYKITGILQLSTFIDNYSHETKQKVTTFSFIDVVPVIFDSDVKQKIYEPNQSRVEDIQPIAFGCETGQLLVCSAKDYRKIICRARYFGERVEKICVCWCADGVIGDMLHRRRLVVVSSVKEIVCIVLSNCNIPQVIYKLLCPQQFSIKQLNPYICSLISDNTPKLLFPSWSPNQLQNENQTPKLKLWLPSVTLHEVPISTIEYCQYLRVISGDQGGRIVMWSISKGEILFTITIGHGKCIQIAYWWAKTVVFGHSGQIFQMDPAKIKTLYRQQQLDASIKIRKTYQLAQPSQKSPQSMLLQSQIFLQQSTFPLSQLFKPQHHSAATLNLKSSINQNSKHLTPDKKQKKQKQFDRSIEKYVSDMKKSLVKLGNQVSGHRDADTERRGGKKGQTSGEKNKIKFHNRHKYQSATKYPTIERPEQKQHRQKQQLNNRRLNRAKTILNKFKQAQQNQYSITEMTALEQDSTSKQQILSLPQIKSISTNLKPNKTIMMTQRQRSFNQKQKERIEENLNRKRKNRNKKYEFLFHFPNAGLYTQLVSKEMLE